MGWELLAGFVLIATLIFGFTAGFSLSCHWYHRPLPAASPVAPLSATGTPSAEASPDSAVDSSPDSAARAFLAVDRTWDSEDSRVASMQLDALYRRADTLAEARVSRSIH